MSPQHQAGPFAVSSLLDQVDEEPVDLVLHAAGTAAFEESAQHRLPRPASRVRAHPARRRHPARCRHRPAGPDRRRGRPVRPAHRPVGVLRSGPARDRRPLLRRGTRRHPGGRGSRPRRDRPRPHGVRAGVRAPARQGSNAARRSLPAHLARSQPGGALVAALRIIRSGRSCRCRCCRSA